MSIIAGAYARNATGVLPVDLIDALRANLSRSKADLVDCAEYADHRLFLTKGDIGAFNSQGKLSNASAFAFVAGEPILQLFDGEQIRSRTEDLALLTKDMLDNSNAYLTASRGQYCAVIYDRVHQRLHLLVDKLGVRPLYVWVLPDIVIFSSAIRIIESIKLFDKTLDIKGVAEHAAFGYPLGDRTAYENVFCLRSAEHVTLCDLAIRREQYWRWDNICESTEINEEFMLEMHRVFLDAVKVRLVNDKITNAFLSGGLDSRVINAALATLGINVCSVSFGPAGSQDQVFAKLFADALGISHNSIQTAPLTDGDSFSKATLLQWLDSNENSGREAERPRLLWSGDGGSVGMGHVYLNEDIVEKSRKLGLNEAVQSFLRKNRIALDTRVLNKGIAKRMGRAIEEGIHDELSRLKPADPGRKLYLFLMLNDQRRHLASHYENIDIGRLDLNEPFFDSKLIELVLQKPIDHFLGHKFYVLWLQTFQPAVSNTPWQAYPGHVPCPIDIPKNLLYQWGAKASRIVSRNEHLSFKKKLRLIAADIPFKKRFASKFMLPMFGFLSVIAKRKTYWFIAIITLHKFWTLTSRK